MSVFQLVYLSAESQPMTTADLRDILAVARRNNGAVDVSGMLLYDEGSFIQVLEGAEPVIERLFERIRLDPRHGSVDVLLRGTVAERDFPDWSMGFCDTGSLPGSNDFLQRGITRGVLDLTVVHKALLFFREGHWRQAG